MTEIILATRNVHKARELTTMLRGLDVAVLTLGDLSDELVLREDGNTFEANALQKARMVYHHFKRLALADDSGLEVFFLNGRPGVFSARYAGEEATDEMNNTKLLEEMRGVAPRRRSSQFRSVLALVGPGSEELTEGICPGRLGETPIGTNGFGYDPIFIPDGFEKTYAELSAEEKNLISHRARSFAKMVRVIQSTLFVVHKG
jgi:XTP/dITP diphosphohydrolase